MSLVRRRPLQPEAQFFINKYEPIHNERRLDTLDCSLGSGPNARRVCRRRRHGAAAGPPASFYSRNTPKDLVEFEMMTWPEVYRAIHHEGKTTALFYTGGTESRGPQNVNGGHNIMARAMVKAIALKLGNALAMPVLPYTPNDASRQLTGTIGLTPDILALVLERVSEEAIITGFKNIILMGDHGGGQPQVYQQVAKKLEDKYAALARNENRTQDVHVYYCNDIYAAAQDRLRQIPRVEETPDVRLEHRRHSRYVHDDVSPG